MKGKFTLFWILGLLIIIIGVPYGLYACTLEGGSSLGGGIILLFVFCTGLIMVIDRVLVKAIKPLQLSLAEFIVGIAGLSIYCYDNREVEIDISRNKTDYFVVAFTPYPDSKATIEKVFPFDKYIRVDDKKYIELNKKWQDTHQINLTTGKRWESIIGVPFNSNTKELQGWVYSGSELELSNEQIDSLIAMGR